jgi:parvulin-like peptidyl-prolyl isomerase
MPLTLHQRLLVSLFLMILTAGCAVSTPTPPSTWTPPAPIATQTSLPIVPTPTTEPLAATVNGEGISLAEFQAEFARLENAQAASADPLSPEEQTQAVLQDLIDQVLLAQAARQGGFSISEAELQARLDQLAGESGGPEALAQWQASHGYSPDDFVRSLGRAVSAAWQRDRIVEAVPAAADQVHARQILVYNQADADRALSQLEAGVDFASLASRYDPVTGGNLGWFPMGYLTDPAVEQAAFALQPGEISPIVQSAAGYHILQVIDRDPQHALSPDARRLLQSRALSDWLEERRAQGEITVLLP